MHDSPPKDDKPLNLPKAIGIFVVAIAIGVGLVAAGLITPTILGLILAAVGGGLVPFTRIGRSPDGRANAGATRGKTSRRWELQLDDGAHTVELEHEYVSGRREIRVDGREVTVVAEHLIDCGGEHPIAIGPHQGVVRISTNGFTFSFRLIVDGRRVEPNGTLGAADLPPAGGRGAGFGATPMWGWALVVACLLLLPLGGMAAGLLALPAAIGCLAVSRSAALSAPVALAACVAITVGMYGAYLLVVAAASGG